MANDPFKRALRIQQKLEAELEKLSEHVRPLIQEKLVTPEKISIYTDFHCSEKERYWVLTEYDDYRELGHRLVYFEEMDLFGLAMKLKDGRTCCIGFYPSLEEAVRCM